MECAEGHDNVVILHKREISPSTSGIKVTRADTCNCSESRTSTTKRTGCPETTVNATLVTYETKQRDASLIIAVRFPEVIHLEFVSNFSITSFFKSSCYLNTVFTAQRFVRVYFDM